MSKTYGECKHYIAEMFHCQKNDVFAEGFNTCEDFEPEVITNGDVIRQGGDYALAHFKSEQRCDVCAYAAPIDTAPACRRPEGKACFDGILDWLNAPADCVKQNGENDTQADLCKVDNTESEGEDE